MAAGARFCRSFVVVFRGHIHSISLPFTSSRGLRELLLSLFSGGVGHGMHNCSIPSHTHLHPDVRIYIHAHPCISIHDNVCMPIHCQAWPPIGLLNCHNGSKLPPASMGVDVGKKRKWTGRFLYMARPFLFLFTCDAAPAGGAKRRGKGGY